MTCSAVDLAESMARNPRMVMAQVLPSKVYYVASLTKSDFKIAW